METLKTLLKKKTNGAGRIAVLGVGSEIRGDDAAGMLVADELEKRSRIINKKVQFRVFHGHTAPENLTGEIRKFKPDVLLIVDAAEMSKKPGELAIFTPEDESGISFSTHKLPLGMMADYLFQEIKCKVIMIGIQPERTTVGAEVSDIVKASAAKAAKLIEDSIAGK